MQRCGVIVPFESITQYNAGQFCNDSGGWHLCTASEYLANDGANNPVPPAIANQGYWLAACIREGDTVFAPTDDICTAGSTPAASMTISWNCDGSAQQVASAEAPVGLSTATECIRVGANSDETMAYWQPVQSSKFLKGAMCCR